MESANIQHTTYRQTDAGELCLLSVSMGQVFLYSAPCVIYHIFRATTTFVVATASVARLFLPSFESPSFSPPNMTFRLQKGRCNPFYFHSSHMRR